MTGGRQRDRLRKSPRWQLGEILTQRKIWHMPLPRTPQTKAMARAKSPPRELS